MKAVTFFWNVSDFLHAHSDISQLPYILSSTENHDETQESVFKQSKDGNVPALWLQVLLNLSAITTDKRAELRHSAIQTIQRIFGNYVDQLSSEAWMLCLRSVLFRMVESNIAVQNRIRASSTYSNEDRIGWNETTKVVLEAVSTLVSTYMDKVKDTNTMGEAWSNILDYLQRYFGCGSHALGASVFSVISGVLNRLGDGGPLGKDSLLKTATIWQSYFDFREAWGESLEDNQDAFVAYAEAFKAIYRLVDQSLDSKDLTEMLGNLESSVIDSAEAPYSSDIDHMTTLQTRVIECFSMVRTEETAVPNFLVQSLSRFIILPYSSSGSNAEKRRPTFVALSKASMALLQTIIIKNVAEEALYTSGAFHSALASLEKPIREKYIWHREGKAPPMWQKASTTALAVLQFSLSYINKLSNELLKQIWTLIVAIANGITRARFSTTNIPPTLSKDESFDTETSTKLRSLITLSLGSSSLPDPLRRTYTCNIFETSILHTPAPGEIPSLTTSPLEDLYKVRLGRTSDPVSTLRSHISYACLSELFALVAHSDSSPARVKLAQAAAPYLILRVALPLRAYIADHPLRGRMPQPESQRRELLYVLKELGSLDSEPAAIPDAPGVESKFKKHLHRVYPLLVKAMRVARNDGEVFEALVGLVDMVGMEFGVLDE